MSQAGTSTAAGTVTVTAPVADAVTLKLVPKRKKAKKSVQWAADVDEIDEFSGKKKSKSEGDGRAHAVVVVEAAWGAWAHAHAAKEEGRQAGVAHSSSACWRVGAQEWTSTAGVICAAARRLLSSTQRHQHTDRPDGPLKHRCQPPPPPNTNNNTNHQSAASSTSSAALASGATTTTATPSAAAGRTTSSSRRRRRRRASSRRSHRRSRQTAGRRCRSRECDDGPERVD